MTLFLQCLQVSAMRVKLNRAKFRRGQGYYFTWAAICLTWQAYVCQESLVLWQTLFNELFLPSFLRVWDFSRSDGFVSIRRDWIITWYKYDIYYIYFWLWNLIFVTVVCEFGYKWNMKAMVTNVGLSFRICTDLWANFSWGSVKIVPLLSKYNCRSARIFTDVQWFSVQIFQESFFRTF